MVDHFSVEYKTFIIVAESVNFLPQVDLGLSYIEQYELKNYSYSKASLKLKKVIESINKLSSQLN